MQAGSILGGKYRLEALLGRGGMGSVWRATHLGLHAPVAIKLIDPLIMMNPEAIERFHREARAAAGLRSPHVVQILDHGVDEATHAPFIAMELMEGESLAQRLERAHHLSPAETARVLSHVSRALGRAHEGGIVHRDLKPDNIFIVRNEDEEIAKVLDFGIAKSVGTLGTDSATRTGAVMGTPYYMSPEQISGAKHVDFRSDLWALGVIACECVTGKRPFDAETIGGLALKICVEPLPQPSSLGPVPSGFDAWFERAVARHPPSRFGSAREFAEELRKVCGGEVSAGSASGHPAHGTVRVTRGVPEVAVPSMSALSRTSNDVPAGVRRGNAGLWFALIGLFVLLAVGAGAWILLKPPRPVETAIAAAARSSEPRAQTAVAAPQPPPIEAEPIEQPPAASAAPPAAVPLASATVPAPARTAPKATAKPAAPGGKVAPTAVSVPPTEDKPVATASATATPKLDARSVINSRR